MDFDDIYLDYLAQYESGFLSTDPPTVIGMDEAVKQLALETGATVRTITGGSMNNRRRRRAKAIRKAGGVRKAGKR